MCTAFTPGGTVHFGCGQWGPAACPSPGTTRLVRAILCGCDADAGVGGASAVGLPAGARQRDGGSRDIGV